jgi:hypothetical protein
MNLARNVILSVIYGLGIVRALAFPEPTPDPAPTPAEASTLQTAFISTPTGLPYAYPTTKTKHFTTTVTSIIWPGAWEAFYRLSIATTLTVTVLEPWPSKPTSFPYTFLQTAISNRIIDSRMTLCDNCATPPSTDVSTQHEKVTSTWVLYQPQPTDLLPDAPLPCEACAPADFTPDPACVALGLDTACQGQCKLLDGLWWCYKRYFMDGDGLAMGRACWGGNGHEFKQLVTPCTRSDHALPCVPCNGTDVYFGPSQWL